MALRVKKRELTIMEILRGSPVLSAFRVSKFISAFTEHHLPVTNIYAEYVHFADLSAPLTDDEHTKLQQLLRYGPSLAEHVPEGVLFLVTPRPDIIAPGRQKPPISRTTAVCQPLPGWSGNCLLYYYHRAD